MCVCICFFVSRRWEWEGGWRWRWEGYQRKWNWPLSVFQWKWRWVAMWWRSDPEPCQDICSFDLLTWLVHFSLLLRFLRIPHRILFLSFSLSFSLFLSVWLSSSFSLFGDSRKVCLCFLCQIHLLFWARGWCFRILLDSHRVVEFMADVLAASRCISKIL